MLSLSVGNPRRESEVALNRLLIPFRNGRAPGRRESVKITAKHSFWSTFFSLSWANADTCPLSKHCVTPRVPFKNPARVQKFSLIPKITIAAVY